MPTPSAWADNFGPSWLDAWGTPPGTGTQPPITIDWQAILCGLDARGTVLADKTLPEGAGRRYTIQKCPPLFANLPPINGLHRMIRRTVTPLDPKTPAQLARRAKMLAANQAWHALTPTQRAAWKPAAKNRRITAYNAFISAFLLA